MGVVLLFPLKVHLLHKATCKVTTFEKLNHTFHPKTFLSRRLPSNNHKRGQSSDISQDLTRSLTTLNPAHLHVSPTLAIWCESHFSTRHSRSIWNSLRLAIGLSEGEVIFRHRRTSVTWFTSPALPIRAAIPQLGIWFGDDHGGSFPLCLCGTNMKCVRNDPPIWMSCQTSQVSGF